MKTPHHKFLHGGEGSGKHTRAIQVDRHVREKNSRVSLRKRRVLQANEANITCPLDFRGISEYPWFVRSCQAKSDLYNGSCCSALLYALGQAESERLRLTGEFRVKDETTFGACMKTLRLDLSEEGAGDSSILQTCFPHGDYFKYVRNSSNCQGIMTKSDFERVVGQTEISIMGDACKNSLLNVGNCERCSVAVMHVIDGLKAISPQETDCDVYTLFYAGGISNPEGPFTAGTAHCIFKVGASLAVETHRRFVLNISIAAPATLVASSLLIAIVCAWRSRKRIALYRKYIEWKTNRSLKPSLIPNTGLIHYSLEELKVATQNFSSKNYIDSGGFGDVYKGVLEDGLVVAVKRMKNCSGEEDMEFVNELDVINSVRHKNLIVLRGCCVARTPSEGHQRFLVYDYMPNGSLYDYLFGKDKPFLTWPNRRKLAIDIATGIAYLHHDARPSIIHRDIKSANILLDENLNARVADFGLAKVTTEGQSHLSTYGAGTMGYAAPECVLYNQISEKSDVYSFGVVLLELISGKKAVRRSTDHSPSPGYMLITDWARSKVNEGTLLNIVDERIRNAGPSDVMENFAQIAMLCCHELGLSRPSMEEAVKFLGGGGSNSRDPGWNSDYSK